MLEAVHALRRLASGVRVLPGLCGPASLPSAGESHGPMDPASVAASYLKEKGRHRQSLYEPGDAY